MRFVLVMLVGLFMFTEQSVAQKGSDIVGYYVTTGSNPGGGTYSGTAEIVSAGGDQYQVYQVVGTDSFIGSGGFDGTTLNIYYANHDLRALYTLQPNGSLVGVWGAEGGPLTGSETLTPR